MLVILETVWKGRGKQLNTSYKNKIQSNAQNSWNSQNDTESAKFCFNAQNKAKYTFYVIQKHLAHLFHDLKLPAVDLKSKYVANYLPIPFHILQKRCLVICLSILNQILSGSQPKNKNNIYKQWNKSSNTIISDLEVNNT